MLIAYSGSGARAPAKVLQHSLLSRRRRVFATNFATIGMVFALRNVREGAWRDVGMVGRSA